MLDSAMSSLHIRLPGDAQKTAKSITAFPPKNTKSETVTIQKLTPTYSVETNTNYIGIVNDALNSESSVTNMLPIELRINRGKVEKIENQDNNNNNSSDDNISDKQIKYDLNNNEVVNKMENDSKKETTEKHGNSRVTDGTNNQINLANISDTKSKLKLIDDILGFDAEKDKLDYFKGQLNGNISAITNKNTDISANIDDNNKTNINIKMNKNISENEIKDLYREYKNAKSPSNLLESNPDYNANKKYPEGKYDPNSILQNSEEINKSQNKKMKVVFARQLNSFSDKEINSNLNNYNNAMNNSYVQNQNTQPSAPPQQVPISRNLTQDPSLFIPSSFSPSNLNITHNDDNRLQNENRVNQFSVEKINNTAKYLSSSNNDVKFEMGRNTNIESNPSFSPSTFPADGAAIRALRNAGIEKKNQEKIINEEREREREREMEKRKINQKENFQITKNDSNLFSFDSDKENNFLNINFSAKSLPTACSPVHDRMDYLNNMKKMRQQLIL